MISWRVTKGGEHRRRLETLAAGRGRVAGRLPFLFAWPLAGCDATRCVDCPNSRRKVNPDSLLVRRR